MNKTTGISLISFLSSIAGIVISFLLLKEDVISTAWTVFKYFPDKYGVIPSTTWDGAIILGVFISVLQIVSASVAFGKRFSISWRMLAGVSLVASVYFDNWTDIIFRSGYGVGDKMIATITTLAFYTFGSEITQSLSWLIFVSLWRSAISDIMVGVVRVGNGLGSIGPEWESLTKKPKQEYQPDRKVTTQLSDPNRYNRQPLFKFHKPK